jgi:hypothetical protein
VSDTRCLLFLLFRFVLLLSLSDYFILIPVFYILPLSSDDAEKTKKAESSTTGKVGQICFHMTGLFVNSKNDTCITYNNDECFHGGGHDHKHSVAEGGGGGGRGGGRKPPPAERIQCWSKVQSQLEKSYSKLRQHDSQYLTYAILAQAVDRIGPIIKAVQEDIKLEKKSAEDRNFKDLDRIHDLKRELERLARTVKPFTRLMEHVIEDETISPGATVYLKDVLDTLEGHEEDIKELISECGSVDDDADKYREGQMNQTLYTLSCVSAIFLPAQFLTGVWGMNFAKMPELQWDYGYLMFWLVGISFFIVVMRRLNYGKLQY